MRFQDLRYFAGAAPGLGSHFFHAPARVVHLHENPPGQIGPGPNFVHNRIIQEDSRCVQIECTGGHIVAPVLIFLFVRHLLRRNRVEKSCLMGK